MNRLSANTPGMRRARGFSLVEVLVGVAIGLIGMLVIFRMVTVWDAHVRTTTAGGDAEVAGTLAMFALERDLKQAGMGFSAAPNPNPDMGCTVQADDGGRAFTFRLLPVQIVVGAGGAPDQINVLYGNSSFFASRDTFSIHTANTTRVTSRSSFKRGDLAVLSDGAGAGAASCTMVQVTDDSNVDPRTLGHINGPYVNFYAAGASAVATFNPAAPPAFTEGNIYSLGPAPQRNTWQINGPALTRTELIRNSAAFEVAVGVVNLKAEYGVDANNNDRIDAGEWTTVTPVDWTQVLAIRVALLVRSKHFERSADGSASGTTGVTTAAPTWFGHAFVMQNLDGGADSGNPSDPNNWRNYRYRVYEKVIPVRNVIWGSSP